LTAEHCTRLEKLWADGKYNNHHLSGWLVESKAGYVVEVVSRPPGSKGYVKLPRRWVVERTFAWLGRYRRHSRDYERYAESSEAMIKVSSIHLMLRLLKPDNSKKAVPLKYRELYGVRKFRALLFSWAYRLGKMDQTSGSHQEPDRCLSRTITPSKNSNR
jgi:putative transposase